ncbi:MAG: tripartite tricarboxylate transporter permease [Lentisphaerota bacterium]
MDIPYILACCLIALAGVGIAAVFSIIPGLHIYNVIAFTMLIAFAFIDIFKALDPLYTTCFIMGMVVGFSVLFTVSSQFFQPCDDSFRSVMLPHERYLFEGRGYEAVMLSGVGSLMALLFIAGLFPFLTKPIGILRELIRPHIYWILGLVIAFVLISEWPKDHGVGKTTAQRYADGWGQMGMGLFTFIAAGVLGMFMFYNTILPLQSAFQSLMPVFIGLFALSSQIMTVITRASIPPQHIASTIEMAPHDVLRGSMTGLVAGMFSCLTPGLTPGPALLMSAHATASSGEKQFIIGGGAARVLYYIGAIVLFFMPDVYMRRGGAAINISLFFVPETVEQYYLISGIIAFSGAISLFLLFYYARLCAAISRRVDFRWISGGSVVLLTVMVAYVTGWQGVVLMLVATALGLVPNVWHTRRIPLLAVLLVPVSLNMAGVGDKIAVWLGFR